jgi:prepilin-type processing-associated H-X9-DG protein
MAAEPNPLPSAQEIADTLEMSIQEAEQMLERIQMRQQRKSVYWPMLSLIELLFTLAILGFLAGILWPNPCINRENAPKAQCLSNVKQLTLAFEMYASDYDERLPPATAWQNELFPYVKNERVWECPSRKEQMPAFSYNALLHCRPLSDIRFPEEQPLVFESDMGRRNASDPGVTFVTPHGKRGHLGYVDGHVKAVPVLPAADAGLISKRLSGTAE